MSSYNKNKGEKEKMIEKLKANKLYLEEQVESLTASLGSSRDTNERLKGDKSKVILLVDMN